MSTKEKYSVYITGIDDGNGVYRDSFVWFYITDSYYLDIISSNKSSGICRCFIFYHNRFLFQPCDRATRRAHSPSNRVLWL